MSRYDDPTYDERVDRLALSAAEFLGGFRFSATSSSLDRPSALLARRILADTNWFLATMAQDELQRVHEDVVDRMRELMNPTVTGDDPPAGTIALAINAGPVTLEKSDCGETLTGTSSFGGSATFPGGATVTACVFTKDQEAIGGSVSGGWSCSF